MSYKEIESNGFYDAVESLKKYRRADLIDDKGRSLLKELYTDLLPNEFILKKCLKENTTFLIGRKGTGKSTIFLRLEQELRTRKNYLPCYLDVKTIYESSQAQTFKTENFEELFEIDTLEKYFVERSFIQNILNRIISEINNKLDNKKEKILKIFGLSKVEEVKEKILEIQAQITNNQHLESIELPTIEKIFFNQKHSTEKNEEIKDEAYANLNLFNSEPKLGVKVSEKINEKKDTELEEKFSKVFLKIFQIKEVITLIKEILSILEIRHLYILLDDFSEIDDKSIRVFVDVILAPLNNWSDEFIKFKVAAYPNRIYYGKIDPGKIDSIDLDFYNLYSEFDRDKMEQNAIEFTKRILEKRFLKFTNNLPDIFFDISKNTMQEFYEILFNASMNVPRILGYILSYCYQSRIIYNNKITKTDIEAAAQRYYEDKIYSFFETTTHSLISINEKITVLQLKELLIQFIIKAKEIKKRIVTKDLKGSIYLPNEPYSSHFHIDPNYEEFIKTLELNYFISKYNDLSDKDGKPVSIYCFNFGLAKKENIYWGKPKGTKFRKYFIERPFNYNKTIKDFLSTTKRIICTNPECNKQFDQDEIKFLEFNNYKCNACGSNVVTESIANEIKDKLDRIEESKILPLAEIKILKELQNSDHDLYAKDIAQEIDYSGQLIGWRAKKLSETYHLINRIKDPNKPHKYNLTEKGRNFFTEI